MRQELEEIHQPHDTLFKASFGHKQVMIDFLNSRLPKETLQRIELDSLRLTNKSFVSKTGRHKHSDLIYQARIDKKKGYIYIVTEHFSEQEKYVPLRQLEYNLPLMRQHLNEGHKKLPAILNICVYNGHEPYKGPITLLEMFEYPDLAKKYLLEEYYLVDLRADTESRIQQDKQATLVELLLKQGKFRDFSKWIEKYQAILNDSSIPYAEIGFYYILAVDASADTLEKLQKNAEPKTKETIMNAAQRLIQQGVQQGMQQGVQQGVQQGMQQGMQQGIQQEKLGIARTMFQEGEPIEKVARWTGLSEASIRSL